MAREFYLCNSCVLFCSQSSSASIGTEETGSGTELTNDDDEAGDTNDSSDPAANEIGSGGRTSDVVKITPIRYIVSLHRFHTI